MNRYDRQMLLAQVGPDGQQRLGKSRALLVGCGALGTVLAEQLARAGVGTIHICDRDIVELTNLQRQTLFDEDDARQERPKAIAARDRLARINSQITIHAHVVDVHSGNIEKLVGAGDERVDVILDGTDNVETRYLINDVAVKHGIPWVYGACVGTGGRVMGVVPGKSACLRCLFETPAAVGELETCDTAGVLAPAASIVASLQVVIAMKMLLGRSIDQVAQLITIDAWDARAKPIATLDARRGDCPACGKKNFEFLDQRAGVATVRLCGRGAVQVRPSGEARLDLAKIEQKLRVAGEVRKTEHFVKCRLSESGLTLTVFADARALVHGTSDAGVARSVYARFVGS